jgi:predicted transcriptional regulator
VDSERADDEQSTEDVQLRYINDIRELRKEHGCTPERLRGRRFLHAALSARLRSKKDQPAIENCIVELKQIIESIGDIEKRGALLASLGLDERYQARILKGRREKYLATFNKSSRPHSRTLQRWEDKAIDITAQIITRNIVADRPDESSKALLVGARPKLVNDLRTVAHTWTFFFSEEGILLYRDTTRWVKAPTTAIEPYLVTENTHLSGSGQLPFEITPIFGCSVDSAYDAGGGTVITTFRLHKRLDPKDGAYPFSYRVIVNGKIPSPMVWWRPETSDTRYEVRIIFHRSMVPQRAWWFTDASRAFGRIEPDPAVDRHLDILDNGCYIYKIFEDAQAGLAHGVAWIWK